VYFRKIPDKQEKEVGESLPLSAESAVIKKSSTGNPVDDFYFTN